MAETLAAAILEIKRDPALRGRVARAGQTLGRERFSSAAIGRRLIEIATNRFGRRAR